MTKSKINKTYLPMSETMYYLLLSFTEPRHGYGAIQYVEEITEGRIRFGTGTVYNSLAKLERDMLVSLVAKVDRRKIYLITDTGRKLLKAELRRLEKLIMNGHKRFQRISERSKMP